MAGESNNYFLKEADSILPDYRINNIILEEKSIRLFCSLDRDNDLNYDSWFGSSEFLKYINFYFILTGDLGERGLGKVYHPKTRVQSLSGGERATGESMLEWESVFQLKELRPRGSGIFRRQSGVINPIFGYEKVNLEEISTGEYYKNNTAFGFSGINVESVINGTAFTNIDPADDTFFEVVLRCDEGWLDIDQTNQANHYRNIISFCQLDIKALSDEYGLQNFIGTLKEYGGPMHYEKLLELSPFVGDVGPSSVERIWQVPKTVEYFEDQEGNPYNGMAHEHSQNNPGPNGYIGWMSGPSGGDMEGRKLLSRRQIPNTKVVSKLHIGRALGFDGNPLTDKNRFLGYPNALDTTGDGVPSPYGDLSFGENILSALRSEVGMGMLEIPEDPENVNTLNTIRGSKLKKLVLNKEIGSRSNFIDFVTTWINQNQNSYSTFFRINKEQILKSNSQFGYLLDFHKEALMNLNEPPTERALLSEANTAQRDSYNFIKKCINKTRIYAMKIKRVRLTNLPTVNNELLTPDYFTYDSNDVQEVLVQFSDSNELPAGVDDTLKANLVEVFNDYYSPSGISSLFRLDDFDLFSNVTHGNYRYSVELTLVDGAKEHLKEFYQDFLNAFKAFERYTKEAEKPYLRNHTTSADEPYDNGGSYDYEKEQFSEVFKGRTDEFRQTIMTAVSTALGASYLINKKQILYSGQMYSEVLEMLKPETADIGNIKMFLDFMQKVGSSLKNRIFKNNTNIEKTMNLGTHKRSVGSGVNIPDALIRLESDMMGNIRAVSKNSVFFSVNDPTIDDQQEIAEFFTLQSEILDETLVQQENQNPDVPNPIPFNSAGQPVVNALSYTRRVIGPLAENYSDIISATEFSPYGESYDERVENQHSNPLNDHSYAVENFGGATFNYLLTKTLSLSEVSTNECGEQVATISSTVEQGIFDSIVSIDNREDFIDQVEEQYKSYYFTKEALGNLYTFIKHTMSNRESLRRMDIGRAQNRSQRYRQMVERGIATEQRRSQANRLRREQNDPANAILTDLYVYTRSNGFVLADTDPADSIGLFMRLSRNNIKTRNGSAPVLVDNVYIDEEAINENSSGVGSPRPVNGSSPRASASQARSSGRTTGGNTGGY
jgi:hypothetical protein